MTEAGRIRLDLAGVPETMLWPFWFRAWFANQPQSFLADPLAVQLAERIDYDFTGRFGRPHVAHAIRARYCDDLVRGFLRLYVDGVVVALGEGLETQLWRVDNGRVHWYSVDLPESIAARRSILPEHERNTLIPVSAFDPGWFAQIPKDRPVFISAAGLFMYFERRQVVDLLSGIKQAFPRAELFFDTIPHWFSRRTMKGLYVTKSYRAPPMPFGIGIHELKDFAQEIGGLKIVSALGYADPYPQQMPFLNALSRWRWLRNRIAPALIHARFDSD
jgi:O-methyltransferase involved in polyketide biosynthesis